MARILSSITRELGTSQLSIRRNTTYNLLGSTIPLAASLLTIPIYLKLIGEARYGVLAIAWLLLGYFGLFDLGLGRATAQRIAALRDNTASERAQTFWTALTLNTVLGVIGGLLIWPAATYFFGNVFNVEDTLRPEMQAAVPWLILAVPMATLSGMLGGALQGRERFLEINMISVSGALLFQLLPLTAVMVWGADLGVLLPTALFARLLTLLILFERCWRHIFHGHSVTFVRSQAGELLRFGGWITVSSFVGPMMEILDRFMIGATTGAAAVSYYAIPFSLSERSMIVPFALNSALFPRFAAVTLREEGFLAREGQCVLVVVMTPLVVAGILLMEPFLAWWITPAFADHSAAVGQVILLGCWVKSYSLIAYAQLQARGRPDLVAKCYLIEVLPYLLILYLGLHFFGLVGAAVAYSVRVLFDFTLLSALVGTLKLSIRMLFLPVLMLTVAYLIATQSNPARSEWFVLVVAHLTITTTWAWWRSPISLKNIVFSQLNNVKSLLDRR